MINLRPLLEQLKRNQQKYDQARAEYLVQLEAYSAALLNMKQSASIDDRDVRIAQLEAALREIQAMPDVEADQRSVIARDALAGRKQEDPL